MEIGSIEWTVGFVLAMAIRRAGAPGEKSSFVLGTRETPFKEALT